jgi:hypothetical protein
LSSYRCLCLPSGLLPSHFVTKHFYAYKIVPMNI